MHLENIHFNFMLSSAVPFIVNKHTLEPDFAVNASINSIVYWFLTQLKGRISMHCASY